MHYTIRRFLYCAKDVVTFSTAPEFPCCVTPITVALSVIISLLWVRSSIVRIDKLPEITSKIQVERVNFKFMVTNCMTMFTLLCYLPRTIQAISDVQPLYACNTLYDVIFGIILISGTLDFLRSQYATTMFFYRYNPASFSKRPCAPTFVKSRTLRSLQTHFLPLQQHSLFLYVYNRGIVGCLFGF